MLQVPPLLAEAWARSVRTAILTDYPSLENQFGEVDFTKPQTAGIGRKRVADEPCSMSEEVAELRRKRARTS